MAFDSGQMVALRADPTWIGGVTAVLPAVGGVPRYRVTHGPGVSRDYSEDQLVAMPTANAADATFGAFRVRLIGHLYALRSTRFLSSRHPLMRLYIRALTRGHTEPVSARLRVADQKAPAGTYLFVVDLWETSSVRPDVDLVTFAVDLSDSTPCSIVERRLLELLTVADGVQDAVGAEALNQARAALDAYAERERRQAVAVATRTNDSVAALGRCGRERQAVDIVSHRIVEGLLTIAH
jgi:hypothetical protein